MSQTKFHGQNRMKNVFESLKFLSWAERISPDVKAYINSILEQRSTMNRLTSPNTTIPVIPKL